MACLSGALTLSSVGWSATIGLAGTCATLDAALVSVVPVEVVGTAR